jgi:predicted nuclease with TOPRIM domain
MVEVHPAELDALAEHIHRLEQECQRLKERIGILLDTQAELRVRLLEVTGSALCD